MDGRVVRAAFRKACHTANVPEVRLHDLRHFAGTMTAQVANLAETMGRLLGHATPDASLRYQSQVNGRAVEIAEALSALAIGRRDLPTARRGIAQRSTRFRESRSREIPVPGCLSTSRPDLRWCSSGSCRQHARPSRAIRRLPVNSLEPRHSNLDNISPDRRGTRTSHLNARGCAWVGAEPRLVDA